MRNATLKEFHAFLKGYRFPLVPYFITYHEPDRACIQYRDQCGYVRAESFVFSSGATLRRVS